MAVMLAMVPSAFPMALSGSGSGGVRAAAAAVDMCQSGRKFDSLKLLNAEQAQGLLMLVLALLGLPPVTEAMAAMVVMMIANLVLLLFRGGCYLLRALSPATEAPIGALVGEAGVCLLDVVELMGEVGGDIVLESTEPDDEVMRTPLLNLSQSHRRSGVANSCANKTGFTKMLPDLRLQVLNLLSSRRHCFNRRTPLMMED
ncbi:hypothetical protein DER46DRAFT_578363 [Fusarium sp. MPI-SDFR-AT-0072]|nr:hypothetical protein DER46DRAFT_578363 [Fusarium sp. MPI-SDFR-AT-0072]